MFGPFERRDGDTITISDRVPPEWEEAAVVQTPGRRPRSLADRAIPREDTYLFAYKVKAWWGVRVDGATVREMAGHWHAKMPGVRHVKKSELDGDTLLTCGCLQTVKKGIKEVNRRLLLPE